MADFLVINLPANAGDPAHWVVVDGHGTRKSEAVTGQLAEAQAAARELPVIVLVPGMDVTTASIDLPVKAGARLRAAVPFALEDQLATDIEELHFATGTHRDSGLLPVAVAARHTVDGWLERLHAAGIYPSRLIPDYHGVQRVPNTMSMLAAEGRVMLNDGGDLEFALEGVAPSDALSIAGLLSDDAAERTDAEQTDAGQTDEKPPPARHLVVWCDAQTAEAQQHDFNALRNELDSVDVHLLDDNGFARLAATVAAGAGINLLQGPYGKKTELAGVLRPWRIAAGLLLATAILGLAGKGVDYLQLARQQTAVQEQYVALYQQLTGDSRAPADPVATAESLLRRLGGNDSRPNQVFLPSLMQLATAVSENRAAAVEAISYRAGVVDIRLSAPDVATLDKIQKLISDSERFNASIQATNQDADGKIDSRIQIRDAGA
ncbi:MAG: type II secretion system protein GspL [Pseudomonadota bacterium]